MSSPEQALASLVSQFALSFDGAFLGVALAYVAIRSFIKFSSSSKALRIIRKAPAVKVSDLRTLLDIPEPSDQDKTLTESQNNDRGEIQKLVIVRGQVEAKSAVDGRWESLRPTVLVSHESGDKAVIVQRTQTCIYNQWKGIHGWTSDIRAIFGGSRREQESKSIRTVPFILVEGGLRPLLDYVTVNMEGSKHPLPLTTVYHLLRPIEASPYTFLQALFGHEYPVGLLDEEKILPLGKDISAVGICSFKNGILEIKSSKDLPYFLSDMTKDQIVADLTVKTKILLWSGIVVGSLSVGILSYAVMRNWSRWKQWRQLRRSQIGAEDDGVSADVSQIGAEDEGGDAPDGQLCVICLMRRRRSAFTPCGHLVCCHHCAISVERQIPPKCPLCRQDIRGSLRIYEG